MRQFLRSAHQRVMASLGMTLKDVVYLEGGLGSQLLSMMVYLQRRENEAHVKADASYFKHGLEVPTDDASGLTGWPWELHRYGFDLADFPPVRTGIRVRVPARDRVALEGHFLAEAARRDWSAIFPIQPTTYDDLQALGLNADSDFACIHVRRGDYLRVSSRVVELEESLGVALRLGSRLPERVVFLSDDEFHSEEREAISKRLLGHVCAFHTGSDQHASHGLMRMASLLITSNSTFSWSAGILSTQPRALVISPTRFFGVGHDDTNRTFQAASDWMLMARH